MLEFPFRRQPSKILVLVSELGFSFINSRFTYSVRLSQENVPDGFGHGRPTVVLPSLNTT